MIEIAVPSEGPARAKQSMASKVSSVVERFEATCAELADLDLSELVRYDNPSDALVELGARVETARRRLAAFDTAYVRALELADEPKRRGATSTGHFLSLQLRLSPSEAKRRVQAAEACGPRPGVTELERRPVLPALAAARAAGLVSDEQTHLIVGAMGRYPETMPPAVLAADEARLVQIASTLPPRAVATKACQLLEEADPAGVLRDFEHRHAQRGGSLIDLPRGGGRLLVDFDDVTHEKWRAVLDPLMRPLPEGPDGRDLRKPEQRLHDAMEAVADRILNGADLPACGGTPATMVIHVTKEQVDSRAGIAFTDNGSRLPVGSAFKLADQCVVNTLIRTAEGVPLALGRQTRLATRGQTIALAARDRGCSFPGCSRPPSWCQRHHVNAWIDDGDTDVDNMCLLCSYHHREFERRGWRVEMRGGLPWWIPPKWLDPDQKPLLNNRIQLRA